MTYTDALAAYAVAAKDEEKAWGPRGSDGRHALPQAVQLYDRLQVALYVSKTPAGRRDPAVRRAVSVLTVELEKARADAEDCECCARWQLAWGRYCDALSKVEGV